MSFIAIRSWSEYQHYKDRTAPWIKLYRDMLDSPMWVMSTDASKLLAICLMMLALRNDNRIPADPEYIKRFGHLEFLPDFSELIKHGFIDLIDENVECLQPASAMLATCPPEERRAEGEEKRSDAEASVVASKLSDVTVKTKTGIPDCPQKAILALYAEHLPTLPQPRVWDGQRTNNLKARWRWVPTAKTPKGNQYATDEGSALEFFGRLFAYVAKSDFLTGRDGKWSGCSLAWLVKAENFAKALEGQYENREAT